MADVPTRGCGTETPAVGSDQYATALAYWQGMARGRLELLRDALPYVEAEAALYSSMDRHHVVAPEDQPRVVEAADRLHVLCDRIRRAVAPRSWHHAICTVCWDEGNPTRRATRLVGEPRRVPCCFCASPTTEGIFVRHNPAETRCNGYHEGGRMTDDHKIDRTDWPAGPWDDEPDRDEWRHAGLPCLAVRNLMGAWCGYAGVPPGHPLHGKGNDDASSHVEVYGGITYADACQDHVCHVPVPGEPDDVWWFGFDCLHTGDTAPRMLALEAQRAVEGKLVRPQYLDADAYRTLEYVRAEASRLAEQLAALA